MRDTVLIADMNELNREMLSEAFDGSFKVIEAEDGEAAVLAIKNNADKLAAMVLDYNLSSVSGIDILEKVCEEPWFSLVPSVIISDDGSIKAERASFKAGATEFSRKPFDPGFLSGKIKKLCDLYNVKEKLDITKKELLETQAKLENKEEELKKKDAALASGSSPAGTAPSSTSQISDSKVIITDDLKTLQRMHDNMVEMIGQMVEYKNPESHNHVRRVKGLTKIMALEMAKKYPEYNLDETRITMIVSAVSLHDIGKIALRDEVLLKPGRLTDEEYEYMKSHTLKGVDILGTIQGVWSPEYDRIVHEVVRSHHEKYDGGGYPDGLKGDDIPVSAQIISLADTYDALVNDRIYKKAFPKDVAFEMILLGDCGVFPPKILECFKACREKMENWENGDLDLGKL